MRKVLVAAIYDKVTKLTVKALAQTNSGKLITLISADIFQIERGLALAPVGLVSPIVNAAAYVLIGVTSGWPYALVTCGIWIATMLTQTYTAGMLKRYKISEG